jgi:hypothetical protein
MRPRIGALNSLLFTMKGLPMTYNRDMQEDKEPLFDAGRSGQRLLEMARVVAESGVLRESVPAAAAEKAGWSRPISPKRWRATARRFIRRIRSCGTAGAGKRAQRQEARRLDAAESLAAFAPEFTPAG